MSAVGRPGQRPSPMAEALEGVPVSIELLDRIQRGLDLVEDDEALKEVLQFAATWGPRDGRRGAFLADLGIVISRVGDGFLRVVRDRVGA